MEPAEPAKPPSRRAVAATATLAGLAAALLMFASVSVSPGVEAGISKEVGTPKTGPKPPKAPGLVTFSPTDATGLVRIMDAAWRVGGNHGAVPNLAPRSLPPGLAHLDVDARKQVFFRGVLPHVLAVNRKIRRDRAAVLAAAERVERGEALTSEELGFLRTLGRRYRLRREAERGLAEAPAAFLARLLRRVDVVPPGLALSQAALESGWGTSRFLLEGNNLFGQWVFAAEKGIAPRRRPEGADYAAARFQDLGQAVAAYVRNLNTLWAYKDFRARRAEFRDRGLPLDSMALAEGLLYYSERREAYVDELRQVIRGNRLRRFDGARLGGLDEARLDAVLSSASRLSALGRSEPDAPDA